MEFMEAVGFLVLANYVKIEHLLETIVNIIVYTFQTIKDYRSKYRRATKDDLNKPLNI